mmetsp:Transcript_27095/g.44031  ORF Transcript_27095/g.44031 Transcript_27095/m.44031 type:complete len:205 (+) Transcript_27095:1031-1645(+)
MPLTKRPGIFPSPTFPPVDFVKPHRHHFALHDLLDSPAMIQLHLVRATQNILLVYALRIGRLPRRNAFQILVCGARAPGRTFHGPNHDPMVVIATAADRCPLLPLERRSIQEQHIVAFLRGYAVWAVCLHGTEALSANVGTEQFRVGVRSAMVPMPPLIPDGVEKVHDGHLSSAAFDANVKAWVEYWFFVQNWDAESILRLSAT